MINILLYAEVDLNLIDGSSIWVASLTELLSDSNKINVDVLLRTDIKRELVIAKIKDRPNVHFIDPWEIAENDAAFSCIFSEETISQLNPEIASQFVTRLNDKLDYDIIVLRSFSTALLLSRNKYLKSKLWVYMTDPYRQITKENKKQFLSLFNNCKYFLCQTEQARSVFCKLLKIKEVDKMKILPPMIPDFLSKKKTVDLDPEKLRLGYSGKLSPLYLINEMLDAFEVIKEKIPEAEFHIVGDKFHNSPPVSNFEDDLYKRLTNTDGVYWYGGVTRDEANEIMGKVNIASSWRDKYFDSSVEMSTKILEYASKGIPILMNPSDIQIDVFGKDYPCYVNTKDEFIHKFLELISSPELYQRTVLMLKERVHKYTYGSILNSILPLLRSGRSDLSRMIAKKKKTILFVGHDLKFLTPVIDYYKSSNTYNVLVDTYQGHFIKDTSVSKKLLERADIIFCEWCLGNTEWYSHNKRKNQILITRLHRQEINLDYLNKIAWNNVNKIIFICQNNMQLFLKKFPKLADKSVLIYNLIDCFELDKPKLPGAEFNLGFIGMSPKLKAPDRAIEILSQLRKIDKRYTLFIKGKMPQEYSWLWNRTEEKEYYLKIFSKIEMSDFKNSVVFDPYGNDIPNWFTKIGFLLSTSDHEGSHQAVAEAMAAGTIPVIRNWDGADQIYPSKYVFDKIEMAVSLIQNLKTNELYHSTVDSVKEYACENFDKALILPKYHELICELLNQKNYADDIKNHNKLSIIIA